MEKYFHNFLELWQNGDVVLILLPSQNLQYSLESDAKTM